jgi:hypothetical protein
MSFNYTVLTILSFSILIAGVIGIIRFAQIRDIYRPFIYLIWIGCVTEIMSMYFAHVYHNNLAVGAIYRLCESLFLLWFFSKLGVFKKHGKVLYVLGGIFVAIWLADNFLSSHLTKKVTFYFDIVYALSIVLLAIRAINDLLFTEKELLKNPTFLICIGLVIFFTYQIIQRMFWLYGLRESVDFRRSVLSILQIINCLTNLIYALAIVWMRKRQPFTFSFDR